MSAIRGSHRDATRGAPRRRHALRDERGRIIGQVPWPKGNVEPGPLAPTVYLDTADRDAVAWWRPRGDARSESDRLGYRRLGEGQRRVAGA